MTTVSGLPLPPSLSRLIEEGFWPTESNDVQAQNLESLVSPDRIKAFAPEEHTIYFYPPTSFCTVRHEINLANECGQFWDWPNAVPHQIDADLTLIIGDFGLGSDAPLALDYRYDRANPRVIRLRHVIDDRKINSDWVEIAVDFDQFVNMIM